MATITSPRTASPAPSASHTSQITASSPISSARTSLDHTRNATSASTPTPVAGKPPQRRNRAALRDYYNIKAKPQVTGSLQRTASVASTQSDISIATNTTATLPSDQTATTTSALTAQLDNPDFKAAEWVRTLLETSSLRDILKMEATLVSEIRNLDGERKALVYDNYSKLIKAVGTIGEMQRSMNGSGPEGERGGRIRADGMRNAKGGLARVEELAAKMDVLRVTARELASRRGIGDEKMRDERVRHREETQKQKRQRDVVTWVLNTPKRLSLLMEAGRVEDAEREWILVKKYLNEWDGVKGVEEIRRACEDIMTGSDEEEASVDKAASG